MRMQKLFFFKILKKETLIRATHLTVSRAPDGIFLSRPNTFVDLCSESSPDPRLQDQLTRWNFQQMREILVTSACRDEFFWMGRKLEDSSNSIRFTGFQIFQTCNLAQRNIREDWDSPTHGRSWTYRGTPDIASTTGRGFWSFWVGSQRSTLWRLCHLCWYSAVSLNFTVSVVRICFCCNIFMIEKQLRFSVIHSRRHLERSEGGEVGTFLALNTHPKSNRHFLSRQNKLRKVEWLSTSSQTPPNSQAPAPWAPCTQHRCSSWTFVLKISVWMDDI